ncbi:MAG: hypothetical protein GEU90_12825 [Gemmatimonas sp.]|nr:hypothetical protein [Gemmatimonas sp.]
MRISELSDEWRALAEQQRRLGAEPQARTLEYCADALRSVLVANDDELLNLQQAADESGYTPDHLGRLIREGRLPNAGRKARPLIRRSDLPSKPDWNARTGTGGSGSDYISGRLFRDISTSKFGV